MPKLSFKNIDLSKSCTITANILSGQLVYPLTPVDVLKLSATQVEALISGWIQENTKWRGTFNRCLERRDSQIVLELEYGELVRMLACHGHPCTTQAANVIVEILNWMHTLIPKDSVPSLWYRDLRDNGERCTYVFFFEPTL